MGERRRRLINECAKCDKHPAYLARINGTTVEQLDAFYKRNAPMIVRKILENSVMKP